MSDQQSQDPDSPGPDSRFFFGQPRDVYVISVDAAPEIPDGQGRLCPQCGRTAWAQSRWCWHCKWDFDRAEVARWHPVKLLSLSIALNIALVILLLGSVVLTHRH